MALFTDHPFRHVIKGVLAETLMQDMPNSPDTTTSNTCLGDGTFHHENVASLYSQVSIF